VAPQDVILCAEHLTKRFGGVTALDDASFALRAGEIHALCGENGAGKSTLIKLLSGSHPVGSYQGRITVAGTEARFRSSRDASAAGIAVIHQELACVDELSVADNIFLGQELTRCGLLVDRRRALARAGEALARFGVTLEPAAPMGSLGIGQKQLVEIVKALSRESRILILDEPTAALAGPEVERLLGILRELRARGIGCIYISHRLEEVLRIADRVTVLRDGATVCTLAGAAATEAGIVRHMVGGDFTERPGRLPQPPGATLLAVQGLAVHGDDGALRLADIGFELRAGEVLGIGGLMGCGRSELLMHLYGAWGRRRAGQVTVAGRQLPAGDPRAALAAGLALVTEDRRRYGLMLEESVGFNLSLASLGAVSRAGLIRAGAEAAANRHWFDVLQIRAGGLESVVGRLSGGNQQKVALGKMLMTGPRVVMLDEPTRGIDIAAKREIYALVDRLTAAGAAVLLVSSELAELIDLSDRILMLRDGRIGGHFERAAVTPAALLAAALGLKTPRRAG
jgi:D-xylose transport system ATP-binding protein